MERVRHRLRRTRQSWALMMALALCAAALGAPDFMPVSELSSGMRGKGLTVFQGAQPEEFEVEILGVLEGAWPKGDMIIARLHGPQFDEAGVASGMSGSPVYIDGRLLGAVAFTWRDLKVPLCGISPIHSMMEAFQPPAGPKPDAGGEMVWQDGLPAVPRLPAEAFAPPKQDAPSTLAPQRIATPVFLSNFDREAAAALAKYLAPFNLHPAVGGAAAAGGAAEALEPGHLMGVQLIGGDMSAVAVGTVTLRDGDRVLGFGHPLFQSGPSELPLTGGQAIVTAPSRAISFKMSTGTAPLGTLVGDYAFGVAGIVGREAPVIPMRVAVANRTRNRRDEYNYTLAVHRAWTGLLSGYAVAASVLRTEGAASPYTATVRFAMDVKGFEPLVIEDRIASGGIAYALMGLGSLANLIMDNPWQEASIRSFDVEVELDEGRHTAAVTGLRLSSQEARPGETLRAWVALRPYQAGETVEKEMAVRIPDDLPPGSQVRVLACDGFASASLSRSQAPGRYRPYGLGQMLRILGELPKGTELALRVSRPGTGVTLEGEAFPNLPESVRRVLTDAPRTGFEAMHEDAVATVETPWVIYGSAALMVRIKDDAQR